MYTYTTELLAYKQTQDIVCTCKSEDCLEGRWITSVDDDDDIDIDAMNILIMEQTFIN